MNKQRVLIFADTVSTDHPQLSQLDCCDGLHASGDQAIDAALIDHCALVAQEGAKEQVPDSVPVIAAWQWDTQGIAPEAKPVIRVEIRRPQAVYNLNRSQHGSGFVFYAPDPASLVGYRIAGVETGLLAWLKAIDPDTISGIWLDCPEAEAQQRGLELDALVLAREVYPGPLWISGGAFEPRHIDNLIREGGCHSLVLSFERFLLLGGESLVRKLNPPQQIPLIPLDSVETTVTPAAV